MNEVDSEELDYYGALRSPEDPDDYVYERLARSPNGQLMEFPLEFNLMQHTQPSRDQGRRGTCSAFTAAAIKEIQENKDVGFNEWMSPEFIYYHRDNKPATGMYGRNVFQILKHVGSVPEHLYPYNSNTAPTEGLYEIAAQYKISNFARVTTVDGLKRALLEIGPCYLQLPLYKSRPIFWHGQDGETDVGGHALAVIGYTEEGFILKNSWGHDWNGDGCVIFPYTDWGIHWECWVSIDEKTPQPIKSQVHIPSKENIRVVKHEHVHVHTYKKTSSSDPSASLTLSGLSSTKGSDGRHPVPKFKRKTTSNMLEIEKKNKRKSQDKCIMM